MYTLAVAALDNPHTNFGDILKSLWFKNMCSHVHYECVNHTHVHCEYAIHKHVHCENAIHKHVHCEYVIHLQCHLIYGYSFETTSYYKNIFDDDGKLIANIDF